MSKSRVLIVFTSLALIAGSPALLADPGNGNGNGKDKGSAHGNKGGQGGSGNQGQGGGKKGGVAAITARRRLISVACG